jgi:hypothetical protein
MIDTLMYTRKLEEAGLTRDQAELMVRTQFNMISDNVVTKNDLNNLEHKFEVKFKDMNHKMDGLEKRLIFKLGSVMVIILGAFGSLLAFLQAG